MPPKVWIWNKPSGGRFASINGLVAGPTHEKELPIGRHPVPLYSPGTPNSVKVTVAAQEQAVVGETPNLAARLQALAEPGAVALASSTRRLTGGLFEYFFQAPAQTI